MEIGALKQKDFQIWVPCMDDAEVLIRYIGIEELRGIMKATSRRDWDRKHQPIEAVDTAAANRLLGRAAVRGWTGITMDGDDYPYTPENCDFLMSKWLEFSRFVNDICIDLQSLMEAEREAKTKNSSLTSGQDKTSRV